MDITDLRIFVELAECGSATRAARNLAMTQPGVSQHLAKLEDELGHQLFERTGKKLEINDLGRELLEKAKKIIGEIDGLKDVSSGAFCPVGTLKLGLTDSSTISIIPPALIKFRKKYPGVKVVMDVSDSSDIEHGVLRGHYEIGIITAGPRIHQALDAEELFYDRIDAIVSKHHPLAAKKRVSMETLAKYPIFAYPRRSRTRRIIDDAFHDKNIHPKEIMDVYFNSGAARLAETGLGVALLSQAFISSEMPKHKCVRLRIEGDPFKRSTCIIRRRNQHLTDAAKGLYDIIMEMTKKKAVTE